MNSNPVILITGAARRIGAQISRTLQHNSMNIAIHYHTSRQEAETLSKDLNAIRPNSAAIFQADLSDIAKLPKLVEEVANKWNRLDVLINNASIFKRSHLGDVSEVEWDDIFNANLKSAFFLTQAAIPYIKRQKGSIINIADARLIRKNYPVYSISKAGLIMMTKTLADELAPDIRVNTISPGQIMWPEGENVLSDEMKDNIVNKTILKRQGTAEDIANSALFLIQNSTYITGENIVVDGGLTLYS